jgi:hypothetical protein
MARLGDRETAPVIAAQSPNGSSDTKITASLVLSEKRSSISDREDGVSSTSTRHKSRGQARYVAIFLSNPLSNRSQQSSAFLDICADNTDRKY